LDYSIEKSEGKVRDIGRRAIKLTDWATFSYYMEGYDGDGKPTLIKITKSV
jgi:hypothetical protein